MPLSKTTLDRYGHLLTDTNYEAAKKLDSILGFSMSEKKVLEKNVRKWIFEKKVLTLKKCLKNTWLRRQDSNLQLMG